MTICYSMPTNNSQLHSKPDKDEMNSIMASQMSSLAWRWSTTRQLAREVGLRGCAFSGMLLSRADYEPIREKIASRVVAITLVALDFDSQLAEVKHPSKIIAQLVNAELSPLFGYYTLSNDIAKQKWHYRLVWEVENQLGSPAFLADTLKQINRDFCFSTADKYAISPLRIWQGGLQKVFWFSNYGAKL